MNIRMYDRDDNTTAIKDIHLDYTVEHYRKSVYGGPKEARITARGDDLKLWSLITRLRCPVIIDSGRDDVWWGIITDVTGTLRRLGEPGEPQIRVGASLESMSNRVAVAYSKVDVTSGDEERDTTAWADDDTSQDVYGIKELLWSASAATQTHAEAARDMKLSQVKYPVATISPLFTKESESKVEITCRGWWHTLGWQYYTDAGTNSVDTATQVSDIITQDGEFFNGVTVRDTSGISIRETRDGDSTALYEAMLLLEMGTTNFRRLLVDVDASRHALIYEEPARSSRLWGIYADGSIKDDYGRPVRKAACPVGFWARFTDIIPASVDVTLLGDPTVKFIDETEYHPQEDKLYYFARGEPDPWEFPVVKDG